MRFDARPYQDDLIHEIITRDSVQVNVGMSLGKTACVLCATETLIDHGDIKHVLVIAPRQVALSTWPSEIEKWGIGVDYKMLTGTPKQREPALTKLVDVSIINYENVHWLTDMCLGKWPFDMVVIDESSKIKSHSTKRFKALKHIRRSVKKWVNLTGTPMPNGVMDLWSQLFFIDGGKTLGKNITAFRNRWFTQDYMGYNWIPRPGAEEEIKKLVKPLCFTLKTEDYIDLPDILYSEVKVKLNKKIRHYYKRMEKDFIINLEGQDISASNAAVLTSKLQQITQGGLYFEEGKMWDSLHDLKLDALGEVLESTDDNVIVIYNFLFDLEKIVKKYPTARTIHDEKDIEDWNNGDIKLLLLHPASSSHGLNLQFGGHTILWYGLTWNAEHYEQMNARLHRSGQEEPVVVAHLVVENSIDEAMMKRVRDKCSAQEALLDYLKRKDTDG